jgi:tRNA nucleotidyltransferase (CCA-adding enzyme)
VEISDSAVRRLLRRLDHAGGGPTLQTWARLVEADKAGRGHGAKRGRNYLPDWLAVADRLGNESAVNTTLLKGPYLADAGIPRGPLWAHIVTMSEEAQDDGAFTDEAGVKTWLAENQDSLRRGGNPPAPEAQAKWLKEKNEKLAPSRHAQKAENASSESAKAAAQV